MTRRVFHAPGDWSAGLRITLDAEESRYLLRVRRARLGDEVELLDGLAARWQARLAAVDGRSAVLELGQPRLVPPVAPLELLLVLPEPRATLDALVHASELGATAVWMVEGEHSPGGCPSPDRIARTLRASQRQCGRPTPPTVHGPTTLTEALAATADRPGVFAHVPPPRHPPPPRVNPHTGSRLLVGPEGGLAPAEVRAAEQAGLLPMTLGPWVLRTPTAVAAGLARLRGAEDDGRVGGSGP